MVDDLSKVEVAIAILHQGDQFLLQLRDDIPTIRYPGHWGFFGGHIEPGENADIAMRRELIEEIGYAPPHLELFRRTEDDHAIRHFYQAPLTVSPKDLTLYEGLDLGLCSIPDIRRGFKYAEKLGEDRPLGEPHRHVLLSFIEDYSLDR